MKYYAGIDVSLKETSIGVVDADGAVLVHGTVLTEPEAVTRFLAKQQITLERIVHESGQLSIWLQRGLEKLGLPVTCIDARRAHKALSAKLNNLIGPMLKDWPIWRVRVGSPPCTSGAKLPTGCAP